MIATNELRIGNWVRIRESDTKVQVESYMLNVSELSNCQPIPLTPEILEKCGFEIHSKYSFWNFITKNGFAISMWMEDKPCAGFEIKGVCYWGEGFTEVKHLHQLQNLYFALTGKELTFKS